jgi:inosine-uridine nucleoside N-ribohydrolase
MVAAPHLAGQKSDGVGRSSMNFDRISRRAFVSSAAAGLAATGLGANAAFAQGGAPRRVIIDTDPGVDDAFALLLAMRSPELKIEGITPVAGNVPLELTLPNALRMVEIAGRTDIPVAVGAKTPLQRRLVTATYAHGENGLGGAVFPAPKLKPIADPASVFIRQMVRKYPGQITMIMLGPQTNLATALASDPDLARMIKGVVMMGGSLSGGNVTPAAEFNVYVDPEAARIVFQSGIPVTMVGLDVTRKTSLTDAHVKILEAANTTVSMAAAKIARNDIDLNRKQGNAKGPNMHDSLALASFLDPTLLTWKPYYVDVETTGELTAGETLGYRPSESGLRGSAPTLAGTKTSGMLRDKFVPNANVAIDVDSARFFNLLIGRLASKA